MASSSAGPSGGGGPSDSPRIVIRLESPPRIEARVVSSSGNVSAPLTKATTRKAQDYMARVIQVLRGHVCEERLVAADKIFTIEVDPLARIARCWDSGAPDAEHPLLEIKLDDLRTRDGNPKSDLCQLITIHIQAILKIFGKEISLAPQTGVRSKTGYLGQTGQKTIGSQLSEKTRGMLSHDYKKFVEEQLEQMATRHKIAGSLQERKGRAKEAAKAGFGAIWFRKGLQDFLDQQIKGLLDKKEQVAAADKEAFDQQMRKLREMRKHAEEVEPSHLLALLAYSQLVPPSARFANNPPSQAEVFARVEERITWHEEELKAHKGMTQKEKDHRGVEKVVLTPEAKQVARMRAVLSLCCDREFIGSEDQLYVQLEACKRKFLGAEDQQFGLYVALLRQGTFGAITRGDLYYQLFEDIQFPSAGFTPPLQQQFQDKVGGYFYEVTSKVAEMYEAVNKIPSDNDSEAMQPFMKKVFQAVY